MVLTDFRYVLWFFIAKLVCSFFANLVCVFYRKFRIGNLRIYYGRLRLEYLKKNKLGLYSDLILNGTLPDHLIEIDKTANERVKSIINELAKKENVDENLKQINQLEWVRCMNNIKNRAEEIVLNELIYC